MPQADLKTLENEWKETITDTTFSPAIFLWLGLWASALQKQERRLENPCPLLEDPELALGSYVPESVA